MSGYSSIRSPQGVLRVPATLPAPAQALLAFLAAVLFYVSLYGELPINDVARFAEQVNSGRYVWDIAHIFMQPATLLWHRYLGFGESAVESQKHINTFAAALGIGIFYYTLCRLDVPLWRRILGSILLAASASMITLAPSGHMKLLVLPFVNGALLCLITWERAGVRRADAPVLALGALLLGLGGAFLVSMLAIVPFATLAIVAITWRRHGSVRRAVRNGVLFSAICGAVFGASMVLGYVAFAGQPVTMAGLEHSVAVKAALRPSAAVPTLSLSGIARVVFGTANNFVVAPHLGGDMRAFLAGEIKDLRPYLAELITEAMATIATLAILAFTYFRAGAAVLKGEPVLVAVAFLCGAQAWVIWYGMILPELMFQLSAPTIILYLLTVPASAIRWTLLPWTAGTLAANLSLHAIPQATYPLHRYEHELARMYSKADLLLYFAAYPGTHYLGFFDLPDVGQLPIDLVLENASSPEQGFAEIRRRILATLNDGGKVVVFSILDPHDWNGGWAALGGKRIPKARVTEFLARNFRVSYAGEVAEMPTWRIERK